MLRDAVHEFFSQRAASARRNLRELFRRGRISLVIALGFLALSIALGGRSLLSAGPYPQRYYAKGFSSVAGWRCGGLLKCFSMTGADSWRSAAL